MKTPAFIKFITITISCLILTGCGGPSWTVFNNSDPLAKTYLGISYTNPYYIPQILAQTKDGGIDYFTGSNWTRLPNSQTLTIQGFQFQVNSTGINVLTKTNDNNQFYKYNYIGLNLAGLISYTNNFASGTQKISFTNTQVNANGTPNYLTIWENGLMEDLSNNIWTVVNFSGTTPPPGTDSGESITQVNSSVVNGTINIAATTSTNRVMVYNGSSWRQLPDAPLSLGGIYHMNTDFNKLTIVIATTSGALLSYSDSSGKWTTRRVADGHPFTYVTSVLNKNGSSANIIAAISGEGIFYYDDNAQGVLLNNDLPLAGSQLYAEMQYMDNPWTTGPYIGAKQVLDFIGMVMLAPDGTIQLKEIIVTTLAELAGNESTPSYPGIVTPSIASSGYKLFVTNSPLIAQAQNLSVSFPASGGGLEVMPTILLNNASQSAIYATSVPKIVNLPALAESSYLATYIATPNSTNAAINSQIRLNFTAPMNPLTITNQSIHLYLLSTSIATRLQLPIGDITPSNNNTSFSFSPQFLLPANTTIYISMDNTITANDGIPLNNNPTLSFITGNYIDSSWPTLDPQLINVPIQMSLTDQKESVVLSQPLTNLNPLITLQFSTAMDPTSITKGGIIMQETDDQGTKVSLPIRIISANSTNTQFRIITHRLLKPQHSYELIVNSQVLTAFEMSLSNYPSFDFVTETYSQIEASESVTELAQVAQSDELEQVTSIDNPLNMSELFAYNPQLTLATAEARGFESQLEADLSAVTSFTRSHRVLLNIITTPDFSYLRCYGTAYIYDTSSQTKRYLNINDTTDTISGSRTPGDYYFSEWAKFNGFYYKLPIKPYTSGLIGEVHQVVFTKANLATLKQICTGNLRSRARVWSKLNQDYQHNYGLSQIYIDNVTIRAAFNDLSFDHPILPLTQSTSSSNINTLVVFGDSLSDTDATSNLFEWFVPNRNYWFAGHFTNGYTWPEYAAQKLNIITYNEAWGAAGINRLPFTAAKLLFDIPDTFNATGFTGAYLPGLVDQVDNYYAKVSQVAPRNSDQTLYALLIGGNDFISYNETPAGVIQGVQTAVTKLITDSKAKNIVILNLPDIAVVPSLQETKQQIQVGQYQVAYNALLPAAVESLNYWYAHSQGYSGIHITVFDTNSIFNDILNNPQKYGMNNTMSPCVNSNYYILSTKMATGCLKQFGRDYVFWDKLHPTTRIHEILGNKFADFVESNYNFASGSSAGSDDSVASNNLVESSPAPTPPVIIPTISLQDLINQDMANLECSVSFSK